MMSVGLVGGLGPESTIDYYRRILERWARERPGSAPSILIDSLDVQYGIKLVEHDRSGLIAYLRSSLERLARAGVDFATITAKCCQKLTEPSCTAASSTKRQFVPFEIACCNGCKGLENQRVRQRPLLTRQQIRRLTD